MNTADRAATYDSFKAHVSDAERRDNGWALASARGQVIAEQTHALKAIARELELIAAAYAPDSATRAALQQLETLALTAAKRGANA